MFRPGDTALVLGSGRRVTVRSLLPGPTTVTLFGRTVPVAHPVDTDIGVLNESDLRPAHPSCFPWTDERTTWERHPRDPDEDVGRVGYLSPLREPLEALVEGLQEAKKYDFNGHWKDGEKVMPASRRRDLQDYVFGHGYFNAARVMAADAQDLLDAVGRGEPLGRWVNLGRGLVTTSAECSYCAAEDIEVETDGQVLRIVGACACPEGLAPNEWELNVPSGKLVVANDLRALFPMMGDRNINHLLERRATSQDYAATGMSHGYVGNSCPGVYRVGKSRTSFKVAGGSRGKEVAGICTDLWWYSMCDLDEFKRRVARFSDRIAEAGVDPVEVALEHWRCQVVDVEPGVYRFRHDDEVDDMSRKVVVYTTIDRVRDPDPVVDFLAVYDAYEITAGQYAQRCVEEYPSLYGAEVDYWKKVYVPWAEMSAEQREHAWQRVADHIFCTNGNGVEWHEKGFPRERLPRAFEDSPVPERMFRRQLHWYPMSEGYAGILDAAGVTGQGGKRSRGDCQALAPSFAKLAFQVLESMVSFGVAPHDGSAGREVAQARKVMGLALRAYRALGERYPEHADPEYLAWVRDGDRADRWVASFDLGPKKMKRHVENLAAQAVLPEDTEYVEVDFRKMERGYFSNGRTWANKETATRFALRDHQPGSLLNGDDNGWFGNAGNAVPLYVVARVAKLGQQAHTGERIVEVAFDYGTGWMRDAGKRKAFNEVEHKAAVRVLTKEEYEALLPAATAFFQEAEAAQG